MESEYKLGRGEGSGIKGRARVLVERKGRMEEKQGGRKRMGKGMGEGMGTPTAIIPTSLVWIGQGFLAAGSETQ